MTPKNIGQRIRYFRKQRNMTQIELAERINVSYQQVQKYENGQTKITLERLLAIAGLLEVPMTSFLEDRLEQSGMPLSEEPGRYLQGELFPPLSREEVTFVKHLRKVQSQKLKETLLRLVKQLAETAPETPGDRQSPGEADRPASGSDS